MYSNLSFFTSGLLMATLSVILNPTAMLLRGAGVVNTEVEIRKDMRSMVTIVTGSNTGIGLETARALAENGATVVLAVRSLERGEKAKIDIEAHLALCNSKQDGKGKAHAPFADSGSVVVRELDLADLRSVQRFSSAFLAEFKRLDVLVLNAGLANIHLPEDKRVTPQGLEYVYATNFMGHFLLTSLLTPRMEETPGKTRLVCLGSVMHHFATGSAILEQAGGRGSPVMGYHDSKLAMILYARQFNRVMKGRSVSAVAVNPGWVASDIWRQVADLPVVGPFAAPVYRFFLKGLALSPKEGSMPSVFAATQDLRGHDYFSPYFVPQPALLTRLLGSGWWFPMELMGPMAGVRPLAARLPKDEERVSGELWRITSEVLTELGFPH
uniref:Uncharacterized protein n=1 Tax=Hemiselmis andersenii TaxID=464988 RepID=A0A6T8PC20_HEMAN